jgi:hypothetical protein
MAFERHEGKVTLEHTFRQACSWLGQCAPVDLQTSRNARFRAMVSEAQRGPHRGEKVIRFMQGGQEYARAYECCWGHYYNCNRTRVGMYCVAVDAAVARH